MILDTFAGAGGWGHALSVLGARDVGLEWDETACKTRAAAGQLTVRADVAQYPVQPLAGKVEGFISSPPCQAWSRAGKRLGIVDQPLVHQAVADLAAGRDTRTLLLTACRDERSLLAAEPMRYLHALHAAGQPEWAVMEEVPDVLPLWRQYAHVLRGWGFSVWTGILNAADYGVPQTRRRAILIASRVHTARPPEPTHAQVPHPPSLFGPGRRRWVSMAEALGWGATDRPVPTVCAGGGPGGGPEPFPSGSRNALASSRTRGTWQHPGDVPDSRVAGGGSSWMLRSNNQTNATVRRADEPAGTLFFGHRANECVWVPEHPASAPPSESAPDGERKGPAVRITAAEAGILQSFPAGYPWQGTKSQQFQQIGNAVPPLLAAHLLAPHLHTRVRQSDFGLAA